MPHFICCIPVARSSKSWAGNCRSRSQTTAIKQLLGQRAPPPAGGGGRQRWRARQSQRLGIEAANLSVLADGGSRHKAHVLHTLAYPYRCVFTLWHIQTLAYTAVLILNDMI